MLIHKGITSAIWLLLALSLAWSPAMAQGLSAFAWLENDHILVQCDTAPNKPAIGASVKIFDNTDKKELASGKTNGEGRFSFPVPQVVREGHSLLLSVDAGQGRSGEWTMSAAEIYSAASLAAGFDEAAIQARENSRAHIPVKPATPKTRLDKQDASTPARNNAAAAEKSAPPLDHAAPEQPGTGNVTDLPQKLTTPQPETTLKPATRQTDNPGTSALPSTK